MQYKYTKDKGGDIMQIKWDDVKDAFLPTLAILGSVYLFGKIVEKNVDVDKNWQDYIDQLNKEKR